jgi:DegV family protein with EDD domain
MGIYMAKVGIVTDTISCLPAEIIKEYDIRIVPIPLSIDSKTYRDQVELSQDEFWKIFPEIKEFTTGAPPLGDFWDVFNGLAQTTDTIFCTFVSKALSATYEAAVQARDRYKSENPDITIEIVDSRTAAGAQGFVVLEAARAAQSGKSLDEVIQVAQDMITRVRFFCAMDTLKYIIKSGRAPKTAYMGEFMQVKPIIGMVNNTGLVENLARAMGKQKAIAKMPEMMKPYVGTGKPLHINAHYTDNIEDGEKLRDLVTSKFTCGEVYLTPYTPVMSGHTGPVVAVSFYS